MKQSSKLSSIFALASTIIVTAASAQTNGLVITVDELGKGNFNGQPIPSTIAVEPFSGIPTLQYTLPFAGTPGDVLLVEPQGNFSDIVRFDGQGHLFFFSDREAGEAPDPADVAQLPPPLTQFPVATKDEVGLEGRNGALYTPTPGQPGFEPSSAAPVTYNIISDVPEPGSLATFALGGGILLLLNWRRSRFGGTSCRS